jgi:hypothetical protein
MQFWGALTGEQGRLLKHGSLQVPGSMRIAAKHGRAPLAGLLRLPACRVGGLMRVCAFV